MPETLKITASESPEPPITEWNKTYGGAGNDFFDCIIQTSDGGYALAGNTDSFGAGDDDFWLVKTDADGNMEWNKTYDSGWTEDPRAVIQTSDGGYALAGRIFYSVDRYDDPWLVKTDSDGNMEWNRTYSGPLNEHRFSSLVQTSDGGYALVGNTYMNDHPYGEFWLVKTDADGNMEWDKTYGGEWSEDPRAVIQTSDGGYLLMGDTSSFGAGSYNAWLVKTDADGNMEWDKTYGGPNYDEYAYSVIQTSDGGYALAGVGYGGLGFGDSWLVKTNSTGHMEWDKTYGGTGNDCFNCITQTSDGGYLLAGATDSFGAFGWDSWLVKLGPESIAPPTIEVLEIKYESWNPLEIPFENIDDARDYIINFEQNGKPEANFGTIPMEIVIENIGPEPAENVVIEATISGIAALASLDEDYIDGDNVYLHPFDYPYFYSVGTIDSMSTKNVTLEIPVKYASVFCGLFKYNEEDAADVLFIAVELNVDLEISGDNTNKIQESIKLNGVANPYDLVGHILYGVLNRLKNKMLDEVYEQIEEYLLTIAVGSTTTSIEVTAGQMHMINTEIEPGTTSFTISALLPPLVTLVTLSVKIGVQIIGIVSTPVAGLATLVVLPPNLRPGDAQIVIETASPDVNVTLIMANVLSENTNTVLEFPWEDKIYYVNVYSNCTTFNPIFNDTKKMISFDVASQSGTIGFCNVTIPKELLRDNITNPWKVMLNTTEIEFIATVNGTHSFVYFKVIDSGTYTIEILGAEVIPEFSSFLILLMFMTATLLIAFLLKKRKKT